MSSCKIFQQDVLDKRIITVDFSPWLGTGPEIASVAWQVPTGLTASDDSFTSTVATNYFKGTNDNKEYLIKCTITTNEAVPREKTQDFKIKIETPCN